MERERDRYIAQLTAQGHRPSFTLLQTRHWLTSFIRFAESEHTVAWGEVTPSQIERWHASLLRAGYDRALASHLLAALYGFLDFLVEEGMLSENPMRGTSLSAWPCSAPDALTPDEMIQLLAAPDVNTHLGLRDRALLELMYCGGLRVSEVVTLNVSDVNLSQMQITAWRQIVPRRLMIDEATTETLSVYLRDGRPQLVSGRASPALFLNYRGSRLSKIAINQMIGRYAQAAGITRRITPQMLTHTLAAHLMDNARGWSEVRNKLTPLNGHDNVLTRRQ
ncbi:MAG: tyrosine-type recombinase/integrase [Anaerolineae bacterium]|nr:tyrosine-type recombinase/integrase [Anaerolineae bacterium]MDW8098109.1 tyrosine-type recombinase/integrase [Anaerolineae bacterium]